MHYGEIKKCDIANGEGVRVSLFVSGCTHHCPGCFNQDTWDFHYGKEYTEETEAEILGALAPSYINGLTLLGGEPFEPQNQRVLAGLLRKVREQYPEKNIWCYSGYLFRQRTSGRQPRAVRSHGRNAVHDRRARGRAVRRSEKGHPAGIPGIVPTSGLST